MYSFLQKKNHPLLGDFVFSSVYMDRRSNVMIEKIKYTTHHPSGKYSAENSFPQVKERMQHSIVKHRIHWWKYAAAASVALLFTAGLRYFSTRQLPEPQIQALVAQNERKQFLLPDGSLVWLNAASRLTYTDAFGSKTREIALTGEAYFEIEKDAERPFVVVMNGTHVQVFGTTFSVRAYSNEHEIIVTLVEGSVIFGKTLSDTHGVVLQPGQQLSFEKDNKHIVVREVDCFPYTAWKDGRLVFRKTPVKDAFTTMERAFGIKIVTTNTSLYQRKITGNFSMDDQPEHILSVMQESLPFCFEIKENTIFINNQ